MKPTRNCLSLGMKGWKGWLDESSQSFSSDMETRVMGHESSIEISYSVTMNRQRVNGTEGNKLSNEATLPRRVNNQSNPFTVG